MTSKNQFEYDKQNEVSMVETSPNFMRQQFMHAIDLLPPSEVAAYKIALECCPDVVETESNLLQFIKYSNYNYQEASKRICNYWNFRKEIFGEEQNRWLRSITDLNSKTVALSIIAVQLASQYLPLIIPQDRNGCPIIYCDQTVLPSQLQKKMGVQVSDKAQTAFYFLHLLADLPGTSTNGFSIVHILTEKKPKTYPNFHRFLSRAIRDCFPIKMNAFHFIYAPILKNCPLKEKYVQETIPYLWQLLQQPYEFTNRTTQCLIVGYSSTKSGANSYTHQLEQLLIEKLHWEKMYLPKLAGGTWTTEEFQKWNQLRMLKRIEMKSNNNTIPLKHGEKKFQYIQHSSFNESIVVRKSSSKHTPSSLLLDENHDIKSKSALDLLADTALKTEPSVRPVIQEQDFFVCKEEQSKRKKIRISADKSK